ncbi:MAG: 30S ribosomal protein S3 [Candidatus Harrisonbacteria bacterium RIFOXYA1_FULL_48_8]|uniref:Small ribosomal subunit protein uS3 n=4 Tax=root TaxID=1 RepID=A0A0G1W384_9BACT|nr:30S ribosomal protein S3 [uncultured organism]KKU76770.1 MAG: 30S ribosomal protein S3 [Candidatus Giovannonibacteria bacterium GW2011_GWB1_47_6b]OGY65051.1 MAG: 30S ribosomal protein S3 [Candidatus Harrisonbacteria bacterium RIFCSPHIGHO2_12_FULL_48_16]OGY68585.1 MAG: 30S ribosomal protein S3 [Candidatus Harrisonbacteria bacterium RIFOXYA1_FULL_48_8]
MGQKIRPFSYRLGIVNNWISRWIPKTKNFKNPLEEDCLIRKIIKQKIGMAGIVRVEIERSGDNTFRIMIKAARPGLVIGRGGKGIEDLTKAIETSLQNLFKKRKQTAKFSVSLNVEELRRSEISAQYTAQSLAWDLEKRLPFRRTMKRYIENAMGNPKEVQGIKIKLSGRLDGAEIARREWLAKGKLPLQTLRANIDYGEATAFNTYGTVGIKVWIYKGEVFDKK